MRTPALSFSNNPNFRDLVRSVAEEESVTFICGAGVSVDAGLPTWPELVHRVASAKSVHDRTAELTLRAGADNLSRTAGLLLRQTSLGEPRFASIATALYGEQRQLPASYLARHIASLATAMPARMAIVTTNFDDVLEVALKDWFPEVVSCSLDDERLSTWWTAFFAPSAPTFHVLHLHGALTRSPGTGSVLEPIVLTEDDFYRHGAQVQEEVKRIIDESSTVVCIGMSLTDPNIVGPLSQRSKKDNSSVFIVSSSEVYGDLSPNDALEYTELREQYLSDLFGVRIVPLSSYAQVHQLVVDLELAVSSPAKYLASTPASSYRYGYRLSRSLSTAYRRLGYASPSKKVTRSVITKASDSLNSMMPGVRKEICRLVRDSSGRAASSLQRATKDLREHVDQEGMGLFLWLPARFDPSDKGGHRRHALTLVGASAYAHREEWSFSRELDISPYGGSTAQKAAFRGQPIFENTELKYEPRLWLANAAVPLALYDSATSSIVTAGVVVLSSTLGMLEDESDEDAVLRSASFSIMPIAQQVEFARYLGEATAELLGVGSA